jgi:hypothetical protein
MKFESEKDILFSVVVLVLNGFMIWFSVSGLISGEIEKNEYWVIIIVLLVVILLFWLYFGTNYKLSQENGLIYRSGPFHGKISLNRITEIIVGQTLWVGFRPATSRKGLIIKYDKYDEIYISPKSNEDFINKILELNKEIKITRL